MSRNSALWSFALIFGTFCASAVAVPIFSNTQENMPSIKCSGGPQVAGCWFVGGLGTESVTVYADSDVSSGGEPEGAGNTFGVDMYTDGPIAPGVLDLSWHGEVIDGAGCCFSGGFGGTVWDLETGTPVPVYSWSSPGFFGAGGVTLPFKLGIPFSVSVSASVGGAGEGFAELGSTAVVSVDGIPEPGTFALMLSALAGTAVLNARRNRRA